MTASWLVNYSMDEIIAKIKQHISNFDRLLVLRVKHGNKVPLIVVELMEIPKTLLNNISDLIELDFTEWTLNNGKIGSRRAVMENYTVTLDATASKISLDVARNKCVCHGQFKFDKKILL